MNEPPASNINIRTSTRLLEREPKKAPIASIETVPFRGSLFPSPTTGPSQCSDSSHRPRTPSWELLLHSFTIGSRSHRSPGQAPTLELEPLWACRSSPPKVDGHRNVLAAVSDKLPSISETQPLFSLSSLSTAVSRPSESWDTSRLANTPPQRESATFNAMDCNKSSSATTSAAPDSQTSLPSHRLSSVDDFCPDSRHIMSTSPESIKYWEGVLDRCNSETRINVPRIGKRDIFMVGNVIVKSDHLDPGGGTGRHLIDANEDAAVKLVRNAIPEIQLPQTYFSSKIRGHDVLIQSRIPGEPLDSIWTQLSTQQKEVYKQQARDIILKLRQITPDTLKYPRYFVTSSEKDSQRKLSPEEVHSLSPTDTCEDLGVAHNDMVMSNIIVNNDRIVGLIGWSNAGYFNWRTVSKIHSKVRCLDSQTNVPIPEYFESEVQWHDLYEPPLTPKKPGVEGGVTPKVATPTTESNHAFPIEEGPSQALTLTPKKVADMKRKSVSRASSVDRSSPAPSINSQPTTKKKGPTVATVKKGTAKRAPAAKKRKLNDLADVDDVASTRASPLSKSSAQRNKKQDSLSATGSPAPETKGPKKARLRRGKLNSDDDENYDESALFCVCRKPDNHTWMIACDGGCEDWFHGRCMNIDPKDADLIDKYICPTCETKSPLRTTWKPMCRLRECRQPARVDARPPSKYCCDQHGLDYMKQAMSRGSRQPSSNAEEYGSNKRENEVESADQFRKLGASPLSAQQEEVQARLSDAMAAPGPSQDGLQPGDVDFESEADRVAFTSDERQRLNQLRKEKLRLDNRKEMLQAREKFIIIAKQRVKHAFERLKSHGSVGNLQLKDLCGFDNRLSLSDEEFDEWRKSEKGALLLGAPDKDSSSEASAQLKSAVDAETIEALTQSLCFKKRCERHKQWTKVMQQDILFEQSILKEQTNKCHQDAEELVRKAVLRVFGGEN
ncbi:Set1 complex component spp1 [Microsporum canis CBS 113480]|uniref:Set1 complex component spp1 n=1 Tax=Arthroderma otae (strain ATCC MYA-4605 / CBS 113480) TaxID=554155 RepID=C5FE87_ARTOC|nr:Set1 complex component spp1 [Microsporum canis CBS 113480]EEQ28121.1 Set1 complex component spp1 [Microsporum canis CBS 113480]